MPLFLGLPTERTVVLLWCVWFLKKNLLWKSNLKSMQLCWDISTLYRQNSGNQRSSFLANEGWIVVSRWSSVQSGFQLFRNGLIISIFWKWVTITYEAKRKVQANKAHENPLKHDHVMFIQERYPIILLKKEMLQQLGWKWSQDLQCVIQPHNW